MKTCECRDLIITWYMYWRSVQHQESIYAGNSLASWEEAFEFEQASFWGFWNQCHCLLRIITHSLWFWKRPWNSSAWHPWFFYQIQFNLFVLFLTIPCIRYYSWVLCRNFLLSALPGAGIYGCNYNRVLFSRILSKMNSRWMTFHRLLIFFIHAKNKLIVLYPSFTVPDTGQAAINSTKR